MEIIDGQQSRLAEPVGVDFVVLTPILRFRLEANTDQYQDTAFVGSIAGTVLTVTLMTFGTIQTIANPPLYGVNVAANTQITGQLSGATGGIGTYTISPAQTFASGILAAGIVGIKQPTRITIQCDVHGPNSPDNVQIISTLLPSLYATDLFKAQGLDVSALYASEPRESPFMNAEQQVEWMWSVDAVLQANHVVAVPQQYADQAKVTIPPPQELTKPF